MNNKNKYFICGFCFGFIFPVVAFLIRYFEFGFDKAVNLVLSDPLLWIITSAPIFLGGLAYFAGVKQDEVEKKVQILNKSENELKEASIKINETFTKLKREHDELLKSKEVNKEFEKLETAIEKFKSIILEIGNYNLTIKLHESTDIFGRHGKELANVLCNTIENLRNVVQEEIDSIQTTAAASQQILATTMQISDNLELQNNNLYNVNSDITHLNQIIDENSHRASNVSQRTNEVDEKVNYLGRIFSKTTDEMSAIESSVNNSKNIIEELYKSSEEIDAILKVINEVADQTNLLALNAAIEAARAGEHGRGFAVVADEVKKLADRTQSATGEIGNTIQKIQKDIKLAAESAQNGAKKTKIGKESVKSAGDFLQEIIERMNKVSGTISELAAATDDQSKTSSHIQEQIGNILQSVDRNKEGVEDISQAAKTLDLMVQQVEEIMEKFRLHSESEKFKLYKEKQVVM